MAHGHLFNGRLLEGRWPYHPFTDTFNSLFGAVFPAPPLGFQPISMGGHRLGLCKPVLGQSWLKLATSLFSHSLRFTENGHLELSLANRRTLRGRALNSKSSKLAKSTLISNHPEPGSFPQSYLSFLKNIFLLKNYTHMHIHHYVYTCMCVSILTSGFLSLNTVVILGQTTVCCGSCPVHGRVFSSNLGLLHLMAVATLLVVTTKISLDIAKYPLGVKMSPVKNNWLIWLLVHVCMYVCVDLSI